jgi:replicative DNA helicase
MKKENDSLFSRVYSNIKQKRERILDGKVNCIPWGLPRFENSSPGIEQGKYYLISANQKVGKTQITDWLFLYNTVQQILDNGLNIRLKVFYFSLEMSKEEKMLSCFANILYVKEGIRISPTDLKSTNSKKVLSEEVLQILSKYKEYFDKIEEVVEFVDDIRNGFGMYNLVREYALANGKLHYRDIEIKGKTTTIEDYYEANDPDEYVMIVIDHISLISTEKRNGEQMNLHQSISVLSSDYLIKLRNRFNYIPVVIQQQSSAQEGIENKKANRLKPTMDGLGDNKLTGRDANVMLGLFSPYRHEIPEYFGYDIKQLKDNIRFLEIMGSRDGGAGNVCPLYFDGAVNFFSELPDSKNTEKMEKVYKFIKNK